MLIAIHRTNPCNKVDVLSRVDRRMETFNKIRSEFSTVTAILLVRLIWIGKIGCNPKITLLKFQNNIQVDKH